MLMIAWEMYRGEMLTALNQQMASCHWQSPDCFICHYLIMSVVPNAQGSGNLTAFVFVAEETWRLGKTGNLQAAHGRKQWRQLQLRNLQVRRGKPTQATSNAKSSFFPPTLRSNSLAALLKSFCQSCSEDLKTGVLSISMS